MSLFRPSELKMYYVLIHYESVWQVLTRLGYLSCIHLIDMQAE